MRKKTVFITGGAGFIGSHLCERLVIEGYRVICIDNLITGTIRNIAGLLPRDDFRFIKHDITLPFVVEGKIDFVLHFASLASPQDYLQFPIETLKAGSLGTHNALGLARAKQAAFMLASTSEVYGDPKEHPQTESYWGNVNSVGVRGCYDESKRFAEALTMAYHRMHSLDTKIIRIFNTYGPRMRANDGRVVPNFIDQALHRRALTVFGKGTQTRSFCYIDDLVVGIIRLLRIKTHAPLNMGNPNEFSILRLAQLVIALTGTKTRVVFKPLPQDDPRQRQPDIALAKQLIRWQPHVSLEEGLTKTIDWFKSQG